MKLTNWKVENYRSIENAEFSPGQFNILIGKNNSGKSSVIKLLKEYAGSQGANYPGISWDEVITRKEETEKARYEFIFSFSDKESSFLIDKLENYGVDLDWRNMAKKEDYFSQVIHEQTHWVYEGEYEEKVKTNLGNTGMKTVFDRNREGTVKHHRVTELPKEDLHKSNNSSGLYSILNDIIATSVSNWQLASAFREPRSEMEATRQDDLKSTGQDLVTVLDTMVRNYPNQFQQVQHTYTEIMDGVTGLRTPFTNNRNTTVMVDEKGFDDGFSLREISAGSKEILTLITRIVKAKDGCDLLMIEEPELHVHPGAQQALYDLLRDVSENGPQIILSTHSDTFVNQTDSDNIIAVRRDIETNLEVIEEEGIDDLLDSLGYEKSEIIQSNVVVFVEGPSDRAVLNELSEKLADYEEEVDSFDELGITVHPLGGDRLRKHGEELQNVLGHIRTPHLFITDSDDEDPEMKEATLQDEIGSTDVYVLREYCIESYLLRHPEAIANPFGFDVQRVREFIDEAEDRPNKKSVLDDLFKELTDGDRGYDEREHAWTIARNIPACEISEELINLIAIIRDLGN